MTVQVLKSQFFLIFPPEKQLSDPLYPLYSIVSQDDLLITKLSAGVINILKSNSVQMDAMARVRNVVAFFSFFQAASLPSGQDSTLSQKVFHVVELFQLSCFLYLSNLFDIFHLFDFFGVCFFQFIDHFMDDQSLFFLMLCAFYGLFEYISIPQGQKRSFPLHPFLPSDNRQFRLIFFIILSFFSTNHSYSDLMMLILLLFFFKVILIFVQIVPEVLQDIFRTFRVFALPASKKIVMVQSRTRFQLISHMA